MAVHVIEVGCEVGEWTYMGIEKSKMLKELLRDWKEESVCLNFRGNDCFNRINNEDIDVPCFTCRKHQKENFLRFTTIIALRMMSWVNMALR